MKITRKQLRRIIKEAVSLQRLKDLEGRPHTEFKDQPSTAGTDQVSRGPDYFSDTIVSGGEGDTVIVGGKEEYIENVPEALRLMTGFSMSETDADNLVFALEDQAQDGYVELQVSFENNRWNW